MPVKGCGCSTTANDRQQCICAGQTGDVGADLGIPRHFSEFELYFDRYLRAYGPLNRASLCRLNHTGRTKPQTRGQQGTSGRRNRSPCSGILGEGPHGTLFRASSVRVSKRPNDRQQRPTVNGQVVLVVQCEAQGGAHGTPRSPRSTRAPTRSSAWSWPASCSSDHETPRRMRDVDVRALAGPLPAGIAVTA
jgi:hypothetical protein